MHTQYHNKLQSVVEKISKAMESHYKTGMTMFDLWEQVKSGMQEELYLEQDQPWYELITHIFHGNLVTATKVFYRESMLLDASVESVRDSLMPFSAVPKGEFDKRNEDQCGFNIMTTDVITHRFLFNEFVLSAVRLAEV